MSVIERVKFDERITDWIDLHSVGDFVWIDELLDFFSSLSAERCVWNVEKTDGIEFLRPSCRESQCYVEFRNKAEWFKGCPFCLKQIEVKEADNGR